MEKLWTTAEVARYLAINEADVERLVQEGKLTCYKLGGKFVRFRPDQVKGVKPAVTPRAPEMLAAAPRIPVWQTRLREFLYFYDFYILSFALLAGVIIYLVWSG